MLRRALLFLCLSSVLAGLTVAGAATASAGLTPNRVCRNFYTGDQHQRLSVCALFWFSDVNTQYRAVIQMHTYILVNGLWADVTSRSITVNSGTVDAFQNGSGTNAGGFSFGNDQDAARGTHTCRINAPSGAVGCSVPNTYRVDFYTTVDIVALPNVRYSVQVSGVSWRDSLGQAHVVTPFAFSFPDTLPFNYAITR
jgi:hypothetical protein